MLALINPFGGTGNAGRLFSSAALAVLREADVDVEIVESRRKGHARQMAREWTEGDFDGVIICGGDGVIHEVSCGDQGGGKRVAG